MHRRHCSAITIVCLNELDKDQKQYSKSPVCIKSPRCHFVEAQHAVEKESRNNRAQTNRALLKASPGIRATILRFLGIPRKDLLRMALEHVPLQGDVCL
jgi:hypothetical protein